VEYLEFAAGEEERVHPVRRHLLEVVPDEHDPPLPRGDLEHHRYLVGRHVVMHLVQGLGFRV